MNLSVALFDGALFWFGWILFSMVTYSAVRTAPWQKLASMENSQIYLASSLLLLAMWQLKAGLHPGLGYHLLGATLFTLMFGWQFAFIALLLVMITDMVIADISLQTLAWSSLLSIVVPVLWSQLVLWTLQRYLPHNFFIYVLGNGFLCGAVSVLLTVAVTSLLLISNNHYSGDFLYHNYWPFLPMFLFAEGFFTGMLITSLVIFSPEWVMTFDDRSYLTRK